ncbi:glycosyltransferase family 2 protein [Falsirhodobacter algicola]|uniref:Glycosyltransferase family 2 protein n=1 Tax=Falsirhodobacter algicola TaxID=2692330 RepID=A0A8J8SKJ4_9RHOB|nr:glycosyltransferase family 2 protein [Falsirhodobacter algicola]QUS35472.1 glycosyltransferase family 2 protein [Falsirhodobacter algicola]
MAEARRLLITCMKNEGPFILDWLAHHVAIGFDHALVFTNDCDDGTVEVLDALAAAGVVTRLDNPYERMKGSPNPQKGALKYANRLPLVQKAEWVLVADVDEYVDIHVGDGSLDALFDATDGADAISMQWRLFGNDDVDAYEDRPITHQFSKCAPIYCPSPLQAWAVKTLFRGLTAGGGVFGKLGIHRPFGPAEGTPLRWVNGSGNLVPPEFFETGWRFGIRDHGYKLVTLNHYAVRSSQSFLVKRDRGRVNHVNRDQGLSYWTRMNFNMEECRSIRRMDDKAAAARQTLDALPGVRAAHDAAVTHHRTKIAALMEREDARAFYDEITSPERKLLSRHLSLLGRGDFDSGMPDLPPALLDTLRRIPVLT